VIATKAAMKLADYVVTEAGFGADLGAEKFVDIKCRKSGLRPDACVIVATVRAIKYHGGADAKVLEREDLRALEQGIVNLERHVDNVRNRFGLECVVSVNRFSGDTEAEIALLRQKVEALGVRMVVATHWADGGAGAEELARAVVALAETSKPEMRFLYEEHASLWDKVKAVATQIYGAQDIAADSRVRARIQRLQDEGYGRFPVCIAKTQYSFSTDATARGAPVGHVLRIREVRLAAGAEFVVMICGDVMTMPGLPKEPAATKIDLTDEGKVTGLF
jgi:formate--tetrahydrofolate ligase